MKKIKALVASATLAVMLSVTCTSPASAKVENRLGGENRYATAYAIAENFNNAANSLDNVVIASGEGFADALNGSILAKNLNSPILLMGKTEKDNNYAFDYIQKYLKASGKVYILGGTASVNTEIENKIKALGYNVERLAGNSRFETNSNILSKLSVKKGTPVFIVNSNAFADALSISSISAIKGYPIIMSTKDSISDTIKSQLNKIKPSKVYIIGGESMLSSKIISQVQAINPSLTDTDIVRIAGKTKYLTNLAVCNAFNLDTNNAVIASGENLSDALAGSALAAKLNAPIILSNGKDFSSQTQYLSGTTYTSQYILGEIGSISKSIEDTLNQPTPNTKEGQAFWSKLGEAKQMQSVEVSSNTAISFSASGLSSEMQEGYNQMVSMIGNKIDFTSNVKVNSPTKTTVKEEVRSTVKFGGMMGAMPAQETSMWLDYSSNNMKMLYKLPKETIAPIAESDPNMAALKDKDYLVLDFNKMGQMSDPKETTIDFQKLNKVVEEFTPQIEALAKEYTLGYKPNLNIISKLSDVTKTPDGRNAEVYRLTLNNSTLSSLMSYTGNNALNFIQKDAVKEFIVSYMNAITDAMPTPEGEAKPDFKIEMDNLISNMPYVSLQYSNFVNKLSSLELLGSKGISIDYYLNENGHAIYETGSMDLKVDLAKFSALSPEPSSALKGVLNLNVNFNTNLTKINETLDINMPVLNNTNSIDFVDLMNMMNAPIEVEDGTEIN